MKLYLISASSPNSEGGFCQFDNVEDLHSSAKLSATNFKIIKYLCIKSVNI
jgi:hypothetical protein